ncbi:hypothetical protein ACTUSQ_06595 [Pantoea ananatis]|uniref:hypothetical protein n=1 Tax=Pantoea ananas TaxID=553 RepID=UPI003FA475DE
MKNQFSDLSGKELVAAGHQFAKTLDADAPLIEIAKLFSEMASRLDCAIARGDELQNKLEAVTAETSTLRDVLQDIIQPQSAVLEREHRKRAEKALKTPAIDAYLNSVRAEGIHFAVNRMLAAWGAGFIEATPGEAADVAGAVLSALEFLPRAQLSELKRDYADKVISEIRAGESKQ